MNPGPFMNVCGRCGQQWWGNHFCPALNAAPIHLAGATPVPILTEADVRRIVRDELARAQQAPTTGEG